MFGEKGFKNEQGRGRKFSQAIKTPTWMWTNIHGAREEINEEVKVKVKIDYLVEELC